MEDQKAPKQTHTELVVYGASDCCLCVEAENVLERIAPGLGIRIVKVDIEGKPELEGKYRSEIPVGFIGATKVFKYCINEDALSRIVARLKR